MTDVRAQNALPAVRLPVETAQLRADASGQSIREALSCLDKAARRMADDDGAYADEVLSLLRAAALLLEEAADPHIGRPAPRLPSGD